MQMNNNQQQLTPQEFEQLRRFTEDPHWSVVEKVLISYIEPLYDISTIDRRLKGDTVKAEVAARQVTIQCLTAFLRDCSLIAQMPNTPKMRYSEIHQRDLREME